MKSSNNGILAFLNFRPSAKIGTGNFNHLIESFLSQKYHY
jgi:hypothetical protein